MKEVKELINRLQPNTYAGRCGKIYTDTSDFMRIGHGDVIKIGGKHYFVLRDEVERSFGLEDPKYWVKRCKLLETGERKLLKLVFYEKFFLNFEGTQILCYRSPRKEARILDLVQGDKRFMQGFSIDDTAGNRVRIIDLIRGKRLDIVVFDIQADHKTYFHEFLPEILEKFIDACEAIAFLHKHGEKHGDIRRDHLWEDSKTKQYRWIDFDYTFDFYENPFGLDIFGLGALLLYLVGKNYYTPQNLSDFDFSTDILASLKQEDYLLLFRNRLANLGKLFPYIPKELNWMLLHFSCGSNVFYETVDEFLKDLRACVRLIK
jgi:hypothetical protein